jgi:hypothetical protein
MEFEPIRLERTPSGHLLADYRVTHQAFDAG